MQGEPTMNTKNYLAVAYKIYALLLLRIFSRMSRTRHASQTTNVNMMLKAQIFSTGMEHKNVWHHGIAVDPGLLGNVTQ